MNDNSRFTSSTKELIFNARKFHIDKEEDLELYHKVMRKYAGDSVLCSEKYFNKESELFIYVEWLGEKDFVDEFICTPANVSPQAKAAYSQNMRSVANKILKSADKKDNVPPSI